MGNKKKERKIVSFSGFNIEINNEDNKVNDQVRRILNATNRL